jgi:hydroxymethylglutaryl-CoA lyase
MEMSVGILGLGDAGAVKNARTAMRYGRTPLEGLPDRVMICEVGPRDGLQNESTVLPVEVKAEFVARLVDAGHTIIETTSFVHPKWVPQLADAEALLTAIRPAAGVRYPVLVPNERGLDRALDLGVRDIAVFGSATETFARRNLNRTVDESLQMFAPVVARAREAGLSVRGYLSMCFGDPWEGEVPVARVTEIAARMIALGCTELSIGDTIGVATPGRVVALLDALSAAGIAVSQVAVHFHDTYGQALANILASLELGIAAVDSSVAGLGGCPYAKGASGNVASEDVLYMLNGLAVATGVDLAKLAAAGEFISGVLGREPVSKVARALKAKAA